MRTTMMIGALMIAGCGTTIPDDATLASDLWTAIDGYESWNNPDGWEGRVVSMAPHVGEDGEGFTQTWINNTAASDWASVMDGGTFSDGAILVKNAYEEDDESTIGPTTWAMQKVDGYDPDNGDWFYAAYDSDGNASPLGKVEGCIGCHSAAADYSFTADGTPE